ncbi:MAG: sensor histidine kinase [Dehalococcoidales bacterium]|nr:sensor histidine kinase [Dehalococcoidales bacterium]
MRKPTILTGSGYFLAGIEFWITLAFVMLLVFFYSFWPWRNIENVPVLSFFTQWAVVEYKFHLVGSIFFIPIIFSALVYWWRGALVILLLSIAGVMYQIIVVNPHSYWILNIIYLLLPFLIVSAVAIEVRWRAKEKKIFMDREKERQIYLSKIFEAQEAERLRISQEIHDDTVQKLVAIANRAQSKLTSSGLDDEDIIWIRDITLQTSEDLRRLSFDLRPSVLDLGLIPALRWLVSNKAGVTSGIHFRFIEEGTERKLPPKVELIIFRIVQETLSNVKRHSRATEVLINLDFTGEVLKIRIQDNGRGFTLPENLGNLAAAGKLGLIGMQQRAQLIGANLEIRSDPGYGTVTLLEIKY